MKLKFPATPHKIKFFFRQPGFNAYTIGIAQVNDKIKNAYSESKNNLLKEEKE